MGNRVLFLVVDRNGNELNDNTRESIKKNVGKEDAMVFVKMQDPENRELYYTLKDFANKIINDVNNFDYVCLVNNGSELTDQAKAIFEEFQTDNEEVAEAYVPFAFHMLDGDKPIVLNKHLWNSMIAYQAGVLDIDLALKQIDSTIIGSYIPVAAFFNQEYYDHDVRFYQQYHLLNNLAEHLLVLGIPKMMIDVKDWDFKMDSVSKEDKEANFKLSREKWNTVKETV